MAKVVDSMAHDNNLVVPDYSTDSVSDSLSYNLAPEDQNCFERCVAMKNKMLDEGPLHHGKTCSTASENMGVAASGREC